MGPARRASRPYYERWEDAGPERPLFIVGRYNFVVKQILLLVLCVLICQLAGAIGVVTTDTGNSPWYQALNKPSFNPPGWIFGPVWITLYALMGVSLYLLLRHWPASRMAVILFGVQLLLNAAWTPIFFGAHQIRWALAVMILLWLAIAGTVVATWFISRLSGGLLLPYLAWVSFRVGAERDDCSAESVRRRRGWRPLSRPRSVISSSGVSSPATKKMLSRREHHGEMLSRRERHEEESALGARAAR